MTDSTFDHIGYDRAGVPVTGGGGAISRGGGSALLRDVTLSNNGASHGGAIMHNYFLSGDTTLINVTLSGSGSSDPDGTIASSTWTGTPNPADTVSPTVTLGAGTHTFSLVVTDNSGAMSAADTVAVDALAEHVHPDAVVAGLDPDAQQAASRPRQQADLLLRGRGELTPLDLAQVTGFDAGAGGDLAVQA